MTTIVAADAVLVDLPLVEPFAAAHGTTHTRTVGVIRLEADDGTVGWGECSALPAATYSPESAAGSHRLLARELLPLLIGGPATVAAIDPLRPRFTRAPMAVAGAEMALLDVELRRTGRSLAAWLGVERAAVPAGVSLGLAGLDEVVARARSLADEGYGRLKVKIQPGHDRDVLAALRTDPDLADRNPEIQLDANGAYGPDAIDLLVGLATNGADALEQPLAVTEEAASVELVERLAAAGRPVPVVGDEAVPSLAEAERLAALGALTGVSIKPARVGGMVAAVALHDRCRELALAATAGGMLETGLGRHALAALAALPGFNVTGDLSPARRWLSADPWPDLVLADGQITVPTGAGVAPPPDEDALDHHTVERVRVEAGPR